VSLLSQNTQRLGQILREGAEGQVGETGQRLEKASSTYWPLMRRLIVSEFSFERSYEEAVRLFKSPRARFAAIDGSLDQNLLGGLAVFWAGAYAATGTVNYENAAAPKVVYDTSFLERGHGLASCVPIYVDSIPEVEPQMSGGQQGDQGLSHSQTEDSTVDNSTIANWIMLFSELYLAYKLAQSKQYEIILLDRSLSGTHSSLIHDTSRAALWKRQCAILTQNIDGAQIDEQDLSVARYRALSANGLLPPRGDYLRHSIIFLLTKIGRPLSVPEIAEHLGLTSEDRIDKLKRFLETATRQNKYFQESEEKYSLRPGLSESWPRIKKIVELFGTQLFSSQSGNPLQVRTSAQPRWLTTLDLAFLSLFSLNLLIETCHQNNIVLIGITKDTTARDLITHLIPVCIEEKVWDAGVENIPTTDRMLLQAVSMFHHTQVRVPWATVEYDTSFQTILPEFTGKQGYVSGAIKNRIILERLFVKSYIQLDKARSDDMFRSNVLFIDRLCNSSEAAPTLKLKHSYGGAVETVEPILWQTNDVENLVQELVMVTLKAMTQDSLPEVFGHNKPLYIADKIAKAQRSHASQMVRAMDNWLITHPALRKYSFYMNTFRARRSEVENARSRA
jgi:hypothetical protein